MLYYGAYYTLPKYIREDGFGFIVEIDRFFTLSSAFSLLFLIYLLIEIKNFMENLRSALDYSAHGLFDKYGDKKKSKISMEQNTLSS